MKFAIVTGASRGLGDETARLALKKGYHLITVARKPELSSLQQEASAQKLTHTHFAADLSDPESVISVSKKITQIIEAESLDEVLLINNAGMVSPIGPVGRMDSEEISKHVSLNTAAPMILLNELKKAIYDVPLTVVNITSGAAERSTYGWSVYGSTKAAINLFTQTAAAEADELGLDELHVAFSPGIMDTEMQTEIRSSSTQDFKDVEKFKQFKQEGQLRSPNEVAELLFQLIHKRNAIESGRVYRVYDLVD
ncbi:SDR family NAD(P)-dependent oxidoreductase [Allobacillus sp. GCM10007491]|uniref:SDR family NAD(P)-dependent oxidoreductase n=1 Tax=Allobacillus saliphilus TaxID=2912308 RepID=A0A941HS79_9BACI|nr:SDR family NAD(P)-dependent oxidoreductase [Allobacillus saliphilus]MBR7553406.1 SDR family NAD(P)-dependent oxidoreductase [Allobacillus saliphilus]